MAGDGQRARDSQRGGWGRSKRWDGQSYSWVRSRGLTLLTPATTDTSSVASRAGRRPGQLHTGAAGGGAGRGAGRRLRAQVSALRSPLVRQAPLRLRRQSRSRHVQRRLGRTAHGARSVVSGQWSVVSDQWSVVNGQWSLVSGQWSVVSGQWSVISGLWSVVNGQWSVSVSVCVWREEGVSTFIRTCRTTSSPV